MRTWNNIRSRVRSDAGIACRLLLQTAPIISSPYQQTRAAVCYTTVRVPRQLGWSELTADSPDWINSAELNSTSLTTDESLNSQQTSQTGSTQLSSTQLHSQQTSLWTHSRQARLDQLSWAQLNFTHNRRVSELTADKPDWINSAELNSNFTHNRRVFELTADKPDWISSTQLNWAQLHFTQSQQMSLRDGPTIWINNAAQLDSTYKKQSWEAGLINSSTCNGRVWEVPNSFQLKSQTLILSSECFVT